MTDIRAELKAMVCKEDVRTQMTVESRADLYLDLLDFNNELTTVEKELPTGTLIDKLINEINKEDLESQKTSDAEYTSTSELLNDKEVFNYNGKIYYC